MFNCKHTILTLLFTCIACLSYSESHAQALCATKQLTSLVEKLQSEGLNLDSLNHADCSRLGITNALSIERSSGGVIKHLGVKLFDEHLYANFPSPIYHFMERYFLELLLEKDETRLQKRLFQERVKITSECFPDVPLMAGLQKMVSAFTPDCSIFISSQHSRYHVLVSKNNQVLCSFYFPMRYELIMGISKLEAEASIYPDILQLVADSCQVTPIDEFDLLPYTDSIYVVNDACYMKEEIRSSAYFSSADGGTYPIRSKAYGAESVRNLFNAAHQWKVTAQVTQKMYKGTNTFEVPVNRLMELMRLQKCRTYVGIRNITGQQIEGVVLALNGELGYQHIFTFTLPTEFLELDEPITMKMSMYSYVPIHNVSSLWETKTP